MLSSPYARLVLGPLAAAAGGLAALALLAPLLEWARSPLAPEVYALLGLVCHQRPSRSWFLLGSQVGLCARAFALYAGFGAFGMAALASGRARALAERVPRGLGALALAPLAIDGGGQLAGLWTSTPLSRVLTGALAALGLVRLGLGRMAPGRARWPLPARVGAAALALLLALGHALPTPIAAQTRAVVLRVGTPVFLVTGEELSSGTLAAGQRIQLQVLRDVSAGGETAIAAGAPATAVVEKVYRAESWGKQGALEVRIEDVEAVDGQRVSLVARQQAEGESKEKTAAVTAIVTGVLCLPLALTGFLFKGGEGTIPKGSEVKAFTAADVTIRPAARAAGASPVR